MKLVLDGKSLVVGLVSGVALAVGLGAVQTEEPQVGRFQIAAAGDDDEIEGYVVDTATGKVWTRLHSIGPAFAAEKLKNGP